jgi:hypothetical protein
MKGVDSHLRRNLLKGLSKATTLGQLSEERSQKLSDQISNGRSSLILPSREIMSKLSTCRDLTAEMIKMETKMYMDPKVTSLPLTTDDYLWRETSATVLAEQMTKLESEIYCQITPRECIAYLKSKDKEKVFSLFFFSLFFFSFSFSLFLFFSFSLFLFFSFSLFLFPLLSFLIFK